MRIGDYILISGKQVTPIKPTGLNTSRRNIQGLRPMNNRNSSVLPQAQILASKILPDNSVLYLINQHGSSSPPTWEERSKIFPIHQAAIEKFERKSKTFMCTQHNNPSNQVAVEESPLKISSQNQRSPSSGSVNGKRKICIGGKAPFGMISPTRNLQSENLQEAMQQGYITKNSFRSDEIGHISNKQLIQEENTTTAASSSSEKKNNKISNKQESKQVQQEEAIKEYSNGFSEIENMSHMQSQNGEDENQQDSHNALNQQNTMITKGEIQNVKNSMLLLSNNNNLQDHQIQKQLIPQAKNAVQYGRSVFEVINLSQNSKFPQKNIEGQPLINQIGSDQSCVAEGNNLNNYQDKQIVQTIEETVTKDGMFGANKMQETKNKSKNFQKKYQNISTSGTFQPQLEKQSMVICKQKNGPIVATEIMTTQSEKEKNKEEEEELLNEYRKHDAQPSHSQSELEQKQEINAVPYLLRLEKSKSQNAEASNTHLRPLVSNLSVKENLNKPCENQQEPIKAPTLESHQDEKQVQEEKATLTKMISELPLKGDFVYGDKAKKITSCRPKENDILMDIEWEPRDNGTIPAKTTVSSKAVRIFDSDLLIDFYESKIKFTYNSNNDKKKLAQQKAVVKKEYLSPPNPKQ